MRFLNLALVTLALAGCAAAPKPAPDDHVAKDFAPPAAGALIVLLPLPQVKELARGHDQLMSQLGSQLQTAGFQVAVLNRANYEHLWQAHHDAVAASPQANGQALAGLAKTVCDEIHCKLVIRPMLVPRVAQLKKSSADWDGVRQTVHFKDPDDADIYRANGGAQALSVDLVAMTAGGTLAFHTHGGVTLTHAINMATLKSEPRSDLFQDVEDMAKAVRVVLSPLAKRDAP